MAKKTSLFLTQGACPTGVTLTSSDTTAWKTVFTASADDANLKVLSCVSDDTSAVNLRVGIDIGGTVFQIATVNIPIAAGTNGVAPAVDLLNSISMPFLAVDLAGKRILQLQAGNLLKVAALATMTSAKTLTVVAIPENY